ncbi:MAG: DUF4416 family protein [Deltaproteobacteria bacterium]|nr:DUF4416 family protein [Deltaproteobacteria bacterium]
MSQPHLPDKVLLLSSLFSPDRGVMDRVIAQIREVFGPIDRVSPEMLFDRTRYYEKEMGWPLYRRFISFEELISPETLVEVKLRTNAIEAETLVQGNRQINIDPGYISPERLILATGKNYIHRVYLNKGIYADLTLIFKRGSFRALEWTYRDYSDPEMIDYFNELRKTYMEKLREMKRID